MTRVHGRLTRFTLGRYPPMALAEARDKAREVLQHGKAGRDPRQVQANERRRAEKERRTTFEATAELFLERHVERHLRLNTAREYRRILQGSDTKDWRSRPITTITRDDAVDLLGRIHERGSPAAANRALAYLSKFFNWCLEQDLVSTSPTSRVRALSASHSRDRVLTVEELRLLWRVIGVVPGVFGRFFAVLLLTGQRRAEVAGMRWSELRDFESEGALWEVPKERTKNGQAHFVPLAPAVRAQLSLIPRTRPFVFTTTGQTGVSGFSKAKRQLDIALCRSCSACGHPPLPAWTLHDLRRSMVTIMNERLSIPPHVVEAVVNHVSGPAKRGVAGVYNRALYLDERRNALCRWASYIDGLASDGE
jgi:integrase